MKRTIDLLLALFAVFYLPAIVASCIWVSHITGPVLYWSGRVGPQQHPTFRMPSSAVCIDTPGSNPFAAGPMAY